MSAFEQELSYQISELEKQLKVLSSSTSTSSSHRDTLTKIEHQSLKQINSSLHHLNAEIHTTEDRLLAQELSQAATRHEKKIKEIRLTIKKMKDETPQITCGASSSSAAAADDGKNHARKIAGNIKDIQLDTIHKLKNINRDVDQTRKIGDEATEMLHKDTDRLVNVNKKLEYIATDVERGEKELNSFIRRMMTDKILICFVVDSTE